MLTPKLSFSAASWKQKPFWVPNQEVKSIAGTLDGALFLLRSKRGTKQFSYRGAIEPECPQQVRRCVLAQRSQRCLPGFVAQRAGFGGGAAARCNSSPRRVCCNVK